MLFSSYAYLECHCSLFGRAHSNHGRSLPLFEFACSMQIKKCSSWFVYKIKLLVALSVLCSFGISTEASAPVVIFIVWYECFFRNTYYWPFRLDFAPAYDCHVRHVKNSDHSVDVRDATIKRNINLIHAAGQGCGILQTESASLHSFNILHLTPNSGTLGIYIHDSQWCVTIACKTLSWIWTLSSTVRDNYFILFFFY